MRKTPNTGRSPKTHINTRVEGGSLKCNKVPSKCNGILKMGGC